jgi:putative component of membrane protein insertase Oxa1/YidC/SpoIIIJ protein YidD
VKRLLILIITIYQKVFSLDTGLPRTLGFVKRPICRFYPTCSEYMKQSIEKHGCFQRCETRITPFESLSPRHGAGGWIYRNLHPASPQTKIHTKDSGAHTPSFGPYGAGTARVRAICPARKICVSKRRGVGGVGDGGFELIYYIDPRSRPPFGRCCRG